MIIGSHVRFNKDQLVGSVKEAISYGANALMLYTGAPQNSVRTQIDLKNVALAHFLMKENGIDLNNVICHAPYIVNLANKEKVESWNFSISFLKGELKRCEELGIKYMVLHPGNALKQERVIALNNIIEGLNCINLDNYNCMIILETMAGKGSECGITTQELQILLNGVNSQNIGVCIDTCHLNDAGYDMTNFDDYLEEFDKLIGIQKIKCVHVNDSKNVMGSHKDRHENIGYGTIGFDALLKIVNNEKLKNVPKILETPYVKIKENIDVPPYKLEIEMLRNGKFNDNLMDDLKKL